MVRISRVLLIFILISIVNSFSNMAYANKKLVFDDAMLFTEGEISKLEEEANKLSDEYNMDIVLVTTDDAEGKSSREYADDFFDYKGFGRGSDYDGILFLIDMDNREAYISTTGIGIRYLTDLRIEKILDLAYDGLSNGDYYSASLGFLSGASTYLEAGIPSDQYNEPEDIKVKNRLTMAEVMISLVGGLVTSGLFFFTTMARYKTPRTYNQYSYRNNSIVNMGLRDDRLISSYVTHRRIPKQTSSSSSSSGRSSTHKSSSGRSHGGGGRKF